MDVTVHIHHTIEFNGIAIWALILLLTLLVIAGVLYTAIPLYTVQLPEQPKEPFGFQKR